MGARKDGAGTCGVAGQRREVAGLEMEFEGGMDGTGPYVLLLQLRQDSILQLSLSCCLPSMQLPPVYCNTSYPSSAHLIIIRKKEVGVLPLELMKCFLMGDLIGSPQKPCEAGICFLGGESRAQRAQVSVGFEK